MPEVMKRLLCALLLGGLLGACGAEESEAPASFDAAAAAAAIAAADALEGEPPLPADLLARDTPALAVAGDGTSWVAYREWEPHAERLLIVPHSKLAGGEGEPLLVHRPPAHTLGLTLAADAERALHLVWSEQRDDGWWLLESVVPRGKSRWELAEPTPPRRLAGGDGSKALHPTLSADAEGRLLLAWQHGTAAGLGLRARLFQDGTWGPELEVGPRPYGNWAPDATSTGPGEFALVWDAAVDGDYDVLLARLSARPDGALDLRARHRVTDTPRLEAHPSVTAHGERLYIAYEASRSEQWGREGSQEKLVEALHYWRETEVVVVEGARRARLAETFMAGVKERLRDSVEKPVVQVDGGGNLLLFFRGHDLPPARSDPEHPKFAKYMESRRGAGAGWRTSVYRTFFSIYDGETWQVRDPLTGESRHHFPMIGSEGRSDVRASVGLFQRGGIAWASVGDGRQIGQDLFEGQLRAFDDPSWWKPISESGHDVLAGRIGRGPDAPVLPTTDFTPLPELRPESPADTRAPITRTLADGTELQLVLGDLHRHTDLSRCSSNFDGPFSDALRYAHDVGQLQFVAITDHFEHMSAYDWWRSLTWMDAYDLPGRTTSLRAYERADQSTGHRNVIAGGADLPLVSYREHYRPARDDALSAMPRGMWQYFEGLPILTIPHTPAGMYDLHPCRMDWLSFEPKYDRLVEIFQAYRGSSEAVDAPRALPVNRPRRYVRPALDGGLHFGFVASSDHQSSFGSFAGAWSTGVSRGEIFGALHERITFASTAKMALWTEWDGVPMGASAQRAPGVHGPLRLEADGFSRRFVRADLIVSGAVVESRELDAATLELEFTHAALSVPERGEVYAYVRLSTADEELGWSSPIRLGAEGWNGPDGLHGREAYGDHAFRMVLDGPFLERLDDPPDDR